MVSGPEARHTRADLHHHTGPFVAADHRERIVEAQHLLDLPVLYRNERFVIYDLR